MICTLIILLTATLALYLYLTFTYWKRNNIPTAKGWYPIVGHVLPVLTMQKAPGVLVQELYQQYKDSSMVGFYKGLVPALIIREPNLVKTVVQTNFPSFDLNGFQIEKKADRLLAHHPLFTIGEKWSIARKRISYGVTSGKLKILVVTIAEVCKKFQDYLDRRLSSNDKYEVELKYLFSKFTGEVAANASVGVEGRCFEDVDDPWAFDQMGQTIFQPNLFGRFLFNFVTLFPTLNHFTMLKYVNKELQQMFRRLVKENLEHRRKESTPRHDFLDLMLRLEKEEGVQLPLDALTAYAFTFYLDGFQTSSVTLSFVGFQLALHQDVQERLREEVKSVMEKHGDELTYESLKEMTYLDQVISESQRCYSTVSILNKVCTEDCTLEGSDGLKCRVKAGTEIVIPVYGMHKDPRYWSDPETFDPDRFSEERKHEIQKMAFLPFGEGMRKCVGTRMALLQVKACLATLVKSYKLELSPKTKLPLKLVHFIFLSEAESGLWVYISKL
ncbi:probable cytochrome P450 6a21 [Ceratina calcarata]|uniref:Probable cytochrome P450 6a21 n=1 Tax=Ceratina calcarata TaxID=156304 RepID=A0AAJ7JIQ6_9HYME|nr:probable cytochrome P450 6a21 [Ceratina calcarata]